MERWSEPVCALRSLSEQTPGARSANKDYDSSFAWRLMLLHIVGEMRQFLRRNPQCFAGLLADSRYNLVVQVVDQFGGFFFDCRRGVGHRFVDARGSFFHLAVEVVHRIPSILKTQTRRICAADAEQEDYFAEWGPGQSVSIQKDNGKG